MGTRRIKVNNVWGKHAEPGAGLDQQRTDLFYLRLQIPPGVLVDGVNATGAAMWDNFIGFAVRDFPMPERGREMMSIKYLQQTNFQIGADTPTPVAEAHIRMALKGKMIQIMERWNDLMSNPRTGAFALTSAVKTTGFLHYLRPTDPRLVDDFATTANFLEEGITYFLDGDLLKSLTPSPVNYEDQATGAEFSATLQIDRYFLMPDDGSGDVRDFDSIGGLTGTL